MKPLCLVACVVGCLAVVISLAPLFPEGPPMIARKANADEARPARSVPRARDPSIAVAEEYEAARKKGTAQALELFIARHGDDPLAEKARADLKRLLR